MLAPQGATVPVQLIVYRSAFPWPGRYGITASPLRPALLIQCGAQAARFHPPITLPPAVDARPCQQVHSGPCAPRYRSPPFDPRREPGCVICSEPPSSAV